MRRGVKLAPAFAAITAAAAIAVSALPAFAAEIPVEVQQQIQNSNTAIINQEGLGNGFGMEGYVYELSKLTTHKAPSSSVTTYDGVTSNTIYQNNENGQTIAEQVSSTDSYGGSDSYTEQFSYDPFGHYVTWQDAGTGVVDQSHFYEYADPQTGVISSQTVATQMDTTSLRQGYHDAQVYNGGTITYAYDEYGRISSYTIPTYGGSLKYTFTYGNTISSVTCDGIVAWTLTTQANEAGQIVAAHIVHPETSDTYSYTQDVTFSYNADGTLAAYDFNTAIANGNSSHQAVSYTY